MEITIILILFVIIICYCYNNFETFQVSYKDMWKEGKFSKKKWFENFYKLESFIIQNNKLPDDEENLIFIMEQNKRYYQYLDYDYSFYMKKHIPFFINYKNLRIIWEKFIFHPSIFNKNIIDLKDYSIFNNLFLNKKKGHIEKIKSFINKNKRIPSRISYNNEEKDLGDLLFEMVNFYHQYIFDVIEKDNFMKNPFLRKIYVKFINDKRYSYFIEKKFPFNTFWYHKYNYLKANKLKNNFVEKKFIEKYKVNYDTIKEFVLENVNNELHDKYKNTDINAHLDEPIFNKILEKETLDNKDQKYFRIKHIRNEKKTEFKKKNLFYRNDKLLKFRIDDKCNENYIFIINIYDPESVNNMWLYVDSIMDVKKLKISINDLKLIGIGTQENIFFDLKNNHLVDSDKEGLHCSLSKTKECNYDIDTNLKNKFKSKYDIKLDRTYKCFGKDAKTKEECINKTPREGIWDTPCLTSEECPFYRKNLNYNNSFGGCINGYCEMPLNVENSSYRSGNKKKPLCYNCKTIYKNYSNKDNDKNYYINQEEEEEETENLTECLGIDCYKCCDDQKNKKLYPNLISSDYAFNNDLEVRSNEINRNLLEDKNMKVIF